MKLKPIFTKSLVGASTGLLALFLFVQTGESSQSSWTTVQAATPAFMVLQGGLTDGQNEKDHDPTQNVGFPTSVLGQPNTPCSVGTADPTPTCSAAPVTGRIKCSALCDSGVECSAFETPAGFAAFCSTLAASSGSNAYCSIQVPPREIVGPTRCSAFGLGGQDRHPVCSTSGEGDVQACSVKQPRGAPQFENVCSAIGGGQAPNSRGAECSVLFGTAGKLACSTFVFSQNASKFCSAVGGNFCSTVEEQGVPGAYKGKCTALRTAQDFTCSVLNNDPQNGRCSVRESGQGPVNGSCGSH